MNERKKKLPMTEAGVIQLQATAPNKSDEIARVSLSVCYFIAHSYHPARGLRGAPEKRSKHTQFTSTPTVHVLFLIAGCASHSQLVPVEERRDRISNECNRTGNRSTLNYSHNN